MSKNTRFALWKTLSSPKLSPGFPHNFSTPCGEVCGLLAQFVEKTTTFKTFSEFYPAKVDA